MRPRNVDEYLAELEPDRREALSSLRVLVLKEAPDAVETIKYRMPTYEFRGGVLCAFASQKRYMSLYVDPGLVAKHRADLGGLSVGKSCIRFQKLEQLPLELIRNLLRETRQNLGSV